MSLPVGTIIRVVQNLLWDDGNIMQNVFNCVIGGSGGPFDEQDVADDMAEWMDAIYTNLSANMAADVSAGEVKCYEYDSVDDDWDEFGTGVATFAPTSAADFLPQGIAALVKVTTTDPDIQGRKYFGGFGENVITDGQWIPTLVTLLAAAAVDWQTIFVGTTTGATMIPGVWSTVKGALQPMAAAFVVNTIANYQRRRRPGVGI